MRAGLRRVKNAAALLHIDYGQTSKDGDFTLIPVPCLGDCDRAPVMMVGPKLRNMYSDDSDLRVMPPFFGLEFECLLFDFPLRI